MSAMIENAVTWYEIAVEYFDKFIRQPEETVRRCKACLDRIIPVIKEL
ncbi:MAG: hypothetical protein IK138_08875 [Lachnospiraceae bacterium]|nr:hypothetical protein [Lachnospiraceae bacterium]